MSELAVKMPDHMLAEVEAAASEDHLPVDKFIVALISEGLDPQRGTRHPQERVARADLVEARNILDRLPDVAPADGDERPPGL